MSRTATAMQNDMLVVNELPGLQSVASATVTPASSSRLASGHGARVENSAPGSRVATVVPAAAASASTSASVVNVQWSTDAAPSSTPSWMPPLGPSWPACRRDIRPAAIAAVRMWRVSSTSKAPRSQNTSAHTADGAQASSIGPATSST